MGAWQEEGARIFFTNNSLTLPSLSFIIRLIKFESHVDGTREILEHKLRVQLVFFCFKRASGSSISGDNYG